MIPSPALFSLCALSEFLDLPISRGTGHVRGSQNHLLCRFMRSSGLFVIPKCPPSQWLAARLPMIPQ